MSLNWKEIEKILEELNIENSSIQKIRQPDFRTLVLDLYAPGKRQSLLISLAQGKTRLHARSLPVKNQVPLQRFAQMLRSRIQGGRITKARQLDQERIIQMDIHRGGETTHLYIRLWGGAGNIIATDDSQKILDAFYRRPRRGEVSGEQFDPREVIEQAAKKGKGPRREFTLRPFPEGSTLNATVEREYHELELEEKLKKLRERANAILEQRRSSIELKLAELENRGENTENADRYKEIGDILTAHLYEIPSGASSTQLPDFYHDNETTEIELDPGLSPHRNAEEYYKKYRKTKGKNDFLQEEIDNLRESQKYIERESSELRTGSSPSEEIAACERFIAKYTPSRGTEKLSPMPGLRFQSGEFTLLVGRNSRENDTLLRHYTRGNDYWLHTRDYPGGYVFIKYVSGKSVPLETLLDAGNLALHYSKGRASGKGELYYTRVKYLRRVREGKEGLVLPTHEKNISVRLDEERLRRIMNAPLDNH